MRKISLNQTKHHHQYWNGLLTGILLGSFFICVLILGFIRFQGFKVAINPEQIAHLVQAQVQNEASRDIPQILEGIKQELPNQITNHLDGLTGLTIGIGKSQVKLPDEIILEIREEFRRIIEAAIITTLNDYNINAYREKLATNAYHLVRNIFKQNIIGKTYIIRASQWFSVPIKIVESTEQHYQIGI